MLENAILDAFLMVIVSGELEHNMSLCLCTVITEVCTVRRYVLYIEMYCTEICTVQRYVLYRDMYCTETCTVQSFD